MAFGPLPPPICPPADQSVSAFTEDDRYVCSEFLDVEVAARKSSGVSAATQALRSPRGWGNTGGGFHHR